MNSEIETHSHDSLKRLRSVIIADDDLHMRRLLSLVFRRGGYSPHTVEDGNKCIELLGSITPNVIVLDINMPKKDGFATCKEIRLNFPELKCPIIFLTARTTPEAIKFAIEVGGNGFIAKPIEPTRMLERVGTIMRNHRKSALVM